MRRVKDKFHTWAQIKFDSEQAHKVIEADWYRNRRMHPDFCNCSNCKAIDAFNSLPWYGKVVGSLIVG